MQQPREVFLEQQTKARQKKVSLETKYKRIERNSIQQYSGAYKYHFQTPQTIKQEPPDNFFVNVIIFRFLFKQ